MNSLRFDHPMLLLLALPALVLAIGSARSLGAMHASRRWISILVRCVLFVALAAALAGPYTVRTTRTLATIIVVDVSGSVRRFFHAGEYPPAVERIEEQVRKALASRGRTAEDLMGIVLFDGKAVSVAQPSAATEPTQDWASVTLAEGTDIGAALRLAHSLIPANAAGRIILFSDGNETVGTGPGSLGGGAAGGGAGGPGRVGSGGASSVLEIAQQFGTKAAGGGVRGERGTRALRVPIDVVPLDYLVTDEVAVERVDAPPASQAGATVSVRVLLSSSGPADGVLRLFMDDASVDLSPNSPESGRPIRLQAGMNIERVEVKLDDRRVHRFRAVFEPQTRVGEDGRTQTVGDTVIENNMAEAFTLSPGRGAILIVDGVSDGDEAAEGGTLARSLRESGFEVKSVAPQGLSGDLLALQEYDLVILQDVAAESVSQPTQTALAGYVQDLGGGLVMIGGMNSFGAGMWRGSIIEPLLPVKLELPERLISAEVAIIFVLDNSGSMWRNVLGSDKTQQEIANDAAALAIRALDRTDQVGVITFNSTTEELIPLGPNSQPADSIQKVRDISSGGGTNAPPALAMASARLQAAKAKTKHIVLLSDGKSQGTEQLPRMAQECVDRGIKVSTIAVGDDADAPTMQRMAEVGGGVFYQVVNPRNLPQVFLRAVRIVRTPLIREEPFEPVVLPTGSQIITGLGTVPMLNGVSLTQARNEPTITLAMTTDRGEPLLAHWQVGLGQVVAFTSDAYKWATPWLDWPGFQRFWAQLARTASRAKTTNNGMVASVIPGDDGSLRVKLTAMNGDGTPRDGLVTRASVYGPESEGAIDVLLDPTGPGDYEAVVPVSGVGSFVAVVKPSTTTKTGAGTQILAPLIAGAAISQGREYRFRSSNLPLLGEIALRSGGRVIGWDEVPATNLFDRAEVPPRETSTPLEPRLLLVLLLLVLLDIATRRVAWDRWIGDLLGTRERIAEPVMAATNLAALKGGAAQRDAIEALNEPAIALGEEEAKKIALEARDRRMASKLRRAAAKSEPDAKPDAKPNAKAGGNVGGESGNGASEPASTTTDEGLLAAKRRAAKRFRDGP